MRSFSSGDRSGRNPSWYWHRGLHDACVTGVEKIEHEYDYRHPKPHRNSLVLHLDTSEAMFDTGIKSIELQNYKIIRDESEMGGYPESWIEGCYWMQDVLTWEKDKYILELILLGEDDFFFTIQFENAQVNRK